MMSSSIFKCFFFSAASPIFPLITAPACPILLPLGAVVPAIENTTGFEILFLIYSAASCSFVPPISPIKTIESVLLSLSKILEHLQNLFHVLGHHLFLYKLIAQDRLLQFEKLLHRLEFLI